MRASHFSPSSVFYFSAKMNWKAQNFARSEPSFLLISNFFSGKHFFFLNASPDLNWLHSPNSAPGRCWCWLASSIVLRSEPFVQIKIKIDENKCLGSSLFGSFLRGKRGRGKACRSKVDVRWKLSCRNGWPYVRLFLTCWRIGSSRHDAAKVDKS